MTSAALANRGRTSGILLVLLGAWGALVPFVGPYFGYAYTPDSALAYTSGRLWLSVLPGAAALLGGLFVVFSDRAAPTGAFLAVLGGIWFVIGQPVIALVKPGGSITPGSPVISHGALFSAPTMRFLEALGFFYGTGVVILFFAALALGEVLVARMAADRYRERMADTMAPEDQYGPAY
jgi:hypothetical protein